MPLLARWPDSNATRNRETSPSIDQCALIDRLHKCGAIIPDKAEGGPDFSMLESVSAAVAYIGQWQHLLANEPSEDLCEADWAGALPA